MATVGEENAISTAPPVASAPDKVEMESADVEKGSGELEGGAGTATLRETFMHATRQDFLLLFVGAVAALLNGVGDPLLIVLFAGSLSAMTDTDKVMETMKLIAILFVGIGFGLQIVGTVQYLCYVKVSSRLSRKMRKAWYAALMRQDIGWYDDPGNNPAGLAAKMSSAMLTYEEGLGAKLAMGIQFFSGTVAALIIGFLYNFYVSLITIALMPLVAASLSWLVKLNNEQAQAKDRAYGTANAVAFESFVGLRTILSLNATRKVRERYDRATRQARNDGYAFATKLGLANGAMLASFNIMYLVITIFSGWALAKQVKETGCDPSGALQLRIKCDQTFVLGGISDEMSGTGIFIALMCIAQAGQFLGSVSRAVDTFSQARKAVKEAVDVIGRKPAIDTEDEGGLRPPSVEGHVVFDKVSFSYPTRPGVKVCEKLCLELRPGTTLALAGASGSGKSTVVQLLQRFYDPREGRILLDGNDLRDLNVRWLRQNMAIVSQEPKLFSGTIAENISLGASSTGREATQREIEEAARMANAHDFIMDFKDGYQTDVGFGGSQLSGGQKQRIAIARALVKNPQVLLLDEATSALDNKSEQVVQEALDRLLHTGKNRTTIVIAHRLSTIRTADVICYVKEGEVVERGSHRELMGLEGGHYRALVEEQDLVGKEGGKEIESASLNSGRRSKARDPRMSLDSGRSEGSIGEQVEEKEKEKEGTGLEARIPLSRVIGMNRPDFGFLAAGVVFGSIAGAMYPLWGLLFSEMIVIFFKPVLKCEDVASSADTLTPALIPQELGGPYQSCQEYWDAASSEIWSQAKFISYFWIAISVITLASSTGMFYGFGAASENLAYRVRNLMFSAYLRQEPGYFDLPENAVGSVSSKLASDATRLKAKTGEPLQAIVMTVFGLILGVVLSFIFMWPVALISLGILPMLGFAMSIQTAIVFESGEKGRETKQEAELGALAGETLLAMRTVEALCVEKTFQGKYSKMVGPGIAFKDLLKNGLVYGASFALQHWTFALLLWFGGWCVANLNFTFRDFSIALFAFFFGLFGLSLAASGLTDSKEAVEALRNIFAVLDRETKIDPEAETGEKPQLTSGKIQLKNVQFTYPARPDVVVCKSLTFKVKAGQKVGLVGPSGSGKSTVIQLIERFYDPDVGNTIFDKKDVKKLNYRWLHNQMALVGQEPMLFQGTIFDNIALGYNNSKEASGDCTMERIVEAATLANAHDFIMDLPHGYDTELGQGGTLLSGGQKQRIAIARALIQKPKVLLLDEATSALDNKSEAVVQRTLDRLIAESKLTTVMIAHRLSTVRNMDVIVVVDEGKVVEAGSHDELMRLKGLYHALVLTSGHSV
ncbi:ABC transporter [Chloropicon roscoffensis]|uniref:ABC transporter n=1 Tax=Chloropicon roscoffensis TaxID=1461544 RepID=A0AAX4P116_9CHLO